VATYQGLRDIALYASFVARAEILRRRYLTISIVRLGQAGEKSCFSRARVSGNSCRPRWFFFAFTKVIQYVRLITADDSL